ncbi:MAG TPA: type IV toxin-antitoxin system AbiEi family antitoxin domain-containing protein [Hyphomicrobiaceae bacterium]|nr:type IV toxin-antitoxin system AbiEi family antitoxin domain-containing protein [Hyphomicrobiaceae bacterium]
MAKQLHGKLNQLERLLPEGLLVDAAWLSQQGYSTGLRSQYVAAGWLQQPVRRVYQRPRGPLAWQQVVISLQTLLARDLVVGGRTALELHGFAHYLQQQTTSVALHGPNKPPTWLKDLDIGVRFAYRNDGRLFRKQRASTAPHRLDAEARANPARPDSITVQPWGPWRWPLMLSTPERAILELLDELPDRETFHQADMLMGGLSTLSPTRVQTLLADCRSVKVKRLFFFFADRHAHAWLKRLDRSAIDLGSGKRMLVKGGRLDAKHLITVPETLDGVQ